MKIHDNQEKKVCIEAVDYLDQSIKPYSSPGTKFINQTGVIAKY